MMGGGGKGCQEPSCAPSMVGHRFTFRIWGSLQEDCPERFNQRNGKLCISFYVISLVDKWRIAKDRKLTPMG